MLNTIKPPKDLQEKLDWLQLIRSRSIGPITFYKLLERFGSAHEALKALSAKAIKNNQKDPVASRLNIDLELARIEKFGAQLIACGEENYPPLLAQIPDAPPLLQVIGNTKFLKKKTIAIVGARNASANGINLAKELAQDLGKFGFLIASGLARGIDTAAHQGAIENGTIAAVAGGLDIIYPPENRSLYEAIIEHGALISEMPLGSEPQAKHFPRRNRLVSGLSRGVVVIEASLKSGSMITARLAQEQGRETMAIPGSPLDPRSKGGNALIKQGAILVETAQDIAEALERPFDPPIKKEPQKKVTTELSTPLLDTVIEKKIPVDAVDARLSVKELLGPSPVYVDDLLRQSQLSPTELNGILLEFELAGQIEWQPGNRVALIT
ncbi:DNA processing protein DprA [Kiloniella litopenaei]|uniref:DNA processing protein DprA n=1 Tax=Kiloniella litopenaei TaxID=1549748 RepID=A0A0M2R9H9_9PROT|nr:DNA-processing protein DprA [Kiloniella litopenaei]KKJ76630.1 DNA processing protein DprA [Kiloniella litopenaei]